MRPIFRRCSARGAFVRNTRTMVQPAIEYALGLMLGACSFLLVGFDHACPRFARLELGPCHACPRFGSRLESCLSPIRISTRIMPVPDSPRLELGPCHACPRFGSRLGSCLSPIRPGSSLAHVMPVPDSDLDSDHACPRFAPARAWPTSCLSPIRISTHGHAPHPPRSTARSSASVVPSPFASPLDVPHPPRSTARSSASRVAS